MSAAKSSFLGKVLDRIERLDADGLKAVVQRLARERSFLETLFNVIEDGVLVVDEHGRTVYFNQAVSRLIGRLEICSRRTELPTTILLWASYRPDRQRRRNSS